MGNEQAAGVDGATDDHLLDWLHRSYSNLHDQFYDDDPYTTFPDDTWSWDFAFSFPNAAANATILQALAAEPTKGEGATLHIVDIGVSHGVQWPTLLEALTRRPSSKPAAKSLLLFADKLHLNLQIQRRPAQTLASEFRCGDGCGDETVVVCAQFRLHHLRHHPSSEDGDVDDDRTAFLRRLAEGVRPDLMVLSEYDGECGCRDCAGDVAAGFRRRAEFVRRFLEAARAAFKGRESEERQVVEGEAATALAAAAAAACEMREDRECWCRRMSAGGFSDEAVDGGRALLRKPDGGWDMKVEGAGDGPISLFWKGQPIIFVTLWRPINNL